MPRQAGHIYYFVFSIFQHILALVYIETNIGNVFLAALFKSLRYYTIGLLHVHGNLVFSNNYIDQCFAHCGRHTLASHCRRPLTFFFKNYCCHVVWQMMSWVAWRRNKHHDCNQEQTESVSLEKVAKQAQTSASALNLLKVAQSNCFFPVIIVFCWKLIQPFVCDQVQKILVVSPSC